jgi:hypothetical protein
LSARIAKPRLDGFSGAGSEFHACFPPSFSQSRPTEAAYWEFAQIKAVPLTYVKGRGALRSAPYRDASTLSVLRFGRTLIVPTSTFREVVVMAARAS